MSAVTEPLSGTATRTTSYNYYEDGSPKDIIDANGNDTHWNIDLESRPISKTYGYGTSSAKTETYQYEATTPRLHSITDASGQVKTIAYDHSDRIIGIAYMHPVNPTPNVNFSWDPYFPRLSSMTDGTGATHYTYAAPGTNGALQVASIAGPFANDTTGFSYDALGRVSEKTIPGGNESFGYDAISRLVSHTTPLGAFTDTYLGETDQPTSRSVTNAAAAHSPLLKARSSTMGSTIAVSPRGMAAPAASTTVVSTAWGYDTNAHDRRLISISNSGISRSYALAYANSSVTNPYDITSIIDTAAKGHPFPTTSHSYTYDLSDRLLTANSPAVGNYSYTYDRLDNATRVASNSGTTTASYNTLNQLATWGSTTYAYDANGNTLSDGAHTYKWDAENRLIEIDYVGSTKKTTFVYDGLGHRRVETEASGGVTTTTRYLWCGSAVCQTRNGSDTVLRRDLDEGEVNVTTGQKLVYMPDQLGSTRDVIDGGTGARLASYDYAPYGAPTRISVTTGTDYQYAGLFSHPASGKYLSTYRPFNEATGRWLNRDPIREVGGTNLYDFVRGNPLTHVDPMGLDGTNQTTANRIVTIAQSRVGFTGWSNQATNGNYGPGTNKCNEFVYDTLTAAGASPGEPNGWIHLYPPTAGQWANPSYNIPGWYVLGPGDIPQPGDVVAQQIPYSDASGHVGIVGPDGTFIGTGDSTSGPPGTVEDIPMPVALGPNPSGPLVYRRWRSSFKP